MMMQIYVAMAPTLVQDLELQTQLQRLHGRAQVNYWPGPDPIPAPALENILRQAEILVTGWDTPPLTSLGGWSPEHLAVRLVAHTAGTIKQLIPLEALERGLPVTHANEALAGAVAEFTVGAIIMGHRNAFAAATRLRQG